MSGLYEDFVPTFVQIIEAQLDLVEKAEAFCATNGVAPAALLEERLAADMLPLKFQLQMISRHSAGAIAHFTGKAAPQAGGDSFEAIRRSLNEALAFLEAVKPSDLAGAENKPLTLEMRSGVMNFTGRHYLAGFAMPNFMFHAAAGYAILRKAGVAIGKRDFLGKIPTAA